MTASIRECIKLVNETFSTSFDVSYVIANWQAHQVANLNYKQLINLYTICEENYMNLKGKKKVWAKKTMIYINDELRSRGL